MAQEPLPSRREATPETRAERWRSPLAAAAGGLLTYLTLSGLAIRYLPFSPSNEWQVLLHTVVGLLSLLPIAIYLVRHWRDYSFWAPTPVLITGYAAGAVVLLGAVSGIVLTWQGMFGTRISYGWSLAHLVGTFVLLAFLGHHLLALVWRDRRAGALAPAQGSYGRWLSLAALLLLAVPFGLARSVPQRKLEHAFPAGYSMPWGADRPFAPSLARTASGGAFDAATLSGSENCGSAGCHQAIADEWEVSAHRWASMDVGFQRIQTEMAKQNGPESTRYCGGCHDPISLFSGAKNLFTDNLSALPGYQEGVSCLVCHSLRETDVKGNAAFVIEEPPRYVFELAQGPAARLVSNFVIRTYPREHVRRLSRKLFKTPEFCAACHKQFIDKEVNDVGWVQLQNQYDNWRKSKWNKPGHPEVTIECRECHMPLAVGDEPAAGDALDYNRRPDDGRYRSHRFLAANQFMPKALAIPGHEKQVELTEKWLRGELEIPEIADKWAKGPAVPIQLVLPQAAAAGEELKLAVVVTSNKVGHDFPTGPLDIIQSWVDVTVSDDSGKEVFRSGKVDPANFIEPGSFLFKAEPVDREGNLIDRHNLWEMVGVRYRRALFPGFSDRAEYGFLCPSALPTGEGAGDRSEEHRFELPPGASGQLHVAARLRYRKIDQYLLNFLFGADAGLTAPITDIAFAEGVIPIVPKPAPAAIATKKTWPGPTSPAG